MIIIKNKEPVKIVCCAISRDGNYIITALPLKLIVWNINTGKFTLMIELPVEVHSIKFMDDSEHICVSGEDGYIQIYNWKLGQKSRIKLNHPASVRTFDFTHTHPLRLVSGRIDGYCTAWDFEQNVVIDNIIPEPTWYIQFKKKYILLILYIFNIILFLLKKKH